MRGCAEQGDLLLVCERLRPVLCCMAPIIRKHLESVLNARISFEDLPLPSDMSVAALGEVCPPSSVPLPEFRKLVG